MILPELKTFLKYILGNDWEQLGARCYVIGGLEVSFSRNAMKRKREKKN